MEKLKNKHLKEISMFAGFLNFFSCSFQIRTKQEHQLKVRNFLPPQSQEPEIFLVDRPNGPHAIGPDGKPILPNGAYMDAEGRGFRIFRMLPVLFCAKGLVYTASNLYFIFNVALTNIRCLEGSLL